MDLYENEEVSEEEAKKYSESINAIFKLYSAKREKNLNEFLDSLVQKLIDE